MVFFTCNKCGASLKKNAVEKHPGQCRPFSLSCMDCLKDFHGQDYAAHTRCLTEDEKYSAKDFQSRPPSNKGEVKQQVWVEIVHHVCDTAKGLSSEQANLLSTLTKHGNIPQKKAKFQNFAKNVWHLAKRNLPVVDSVWGLLDAEHKTRKENSIADEAKVEKVSTATEEKAVTSGANTETMEVSSENLSKKERKEKRKREKYEAELLEIKNADGIDSNLNDKNSNDTEIKEETSDRPIKKSKKDRERNGTPDVDLNQHAAEGKRKKKKGSSTVNETETECAEETIPEELSGKSKRKKKRVHDDDGPCEPAVKKTKNDEGNAMNGNAESTPVKSLKFNWSDMILQILQSTDDNELLVKRLRKKVLAHYQEMVGNGNDAADNKIVAKFNKKLAKTPGVVVLKDRAKLKC